MLRNPIASRQFPKNFVWGVAAAATQIEGAAFEDGKGISIWDTFPKIKGKVINGESPEVACDHYHRYKEDFSLMAKLGVKHYRLSIAWPRIFPNGDGAVNGKGLDFYKKLIDAMLKKGITPWVTMYHWDLPQSLEDRGGWRKRVVVDAFATYADTIVKALSPQVKNWITMNEIMCFTRLGYGGGDKAPGTHESEKIVNQTYHHALLCHGHGVRAVREYGGRGAKVGLTDNPSAPIPLTETAADIKAAQRQFVLDNVRVLDPLYRGKYTKDYFSVVGKDGATVEKGDFDLISAKTDFLGLNLYTGYFVRAGKKGKIERAEFPSTYPRATSPWLYWASQGMYWATRHIAAEYGEKALYITENGAGYDEEVPQKDAEPNDLHRRELVRNNLSEFHRAIQDGVPIKGYFLWSFMDNYEWQDGYSRRFGIVYVDFKTQKRTPKLSAHWYAKVMKENAIV